MPFAGVNSNRSVAYHYINHKLEDMVASLKNARLLLANAADKVSNSAVYMSLKLLVNKTIDCEHDLETLIHMEADDAPVKEVQITHHYFPPNRYSSFSSVALYCEHVYVEKYMQLLNDCHISAQVKEVLQHHAEALKSALLRMDTLMGFIQDPL